MTEKNNHIKKSISLDSIEKKAVFEVNKAYFDDLPTKIQNKVIASEQRRKPAYIMSRSLRYALPAIALIVLSIYFGDRFNATEIDVQALIDEVSTEELVAYLSESEISTDEIIALIDVDELDIDGMLNDEINLLEDLDFDDILEEYPDLETDFND